MELPRGPAPAALCGQTDSLGVCAGHGSGRDSLWCVRPSVHFAARTRYRAQLDSDYSGVVVTQNFSLILSLFVSLFRAVLLMVFEVRHVAFLCL